MHPSMPSGGGGGEGASTDLEFFMQVLLKGLSTDVSAIFIDLFEN